MTRRSSGIFLLWSSLKEVLRREGFEDSEVFWGRTQRVASLQSLVLLSGPGISTSERVVRTRSVDLVEVCAITRIERL